MARIGILGAVLCVLAAGVDAAEDFFVDASRHGERFDLRAGALVAAPPALVWQVLTDYERLPRFVPGLSRSIVRLREGNRALVQQSGEARFLVFSYPIEVELEVNESPTDWVESRAVGGNVRRMHGRYELHPQARGTMLLYDGEIVPDFHLPRFIGTAAVRTMIEQQFTAMVGEIERRSGGAP